MDWSKSVVLNLFITRECGVVMFSVASVCMSVCLSVCNALTFDSPGPRKFIFDGHVHIQKIYVNSYIKVIESRSRSQEQKRVCVSCLWVVCLRLKGNLVCFPHSINGSMKLSHYK